VEAVEVGLTTAEVVIVSALVVFSSHASSSSSSLESMRMMILSSSGGPRTSRLRSPKSFLVNSSSHKMLEMRPSSSEDEDKSTSRTFSEGPPCSNTGEHGWHEEISDGDAGGGGDPNDIGGGVEPPLSEEEPSLEGEGARLVPLLSSIVG
jgi:hypothetical protein